MGTTQTSLSEWLHIIQDEFTEIPGLNLTRPQVQRLWGLDRPTCDALLGALIDGHFLRRTDSGTYVRVETENGFTVHRVSFAA